MATFNIGDKVRYTGDPSLLGYGKTDIREGVVVHRFGGMIVGVSEDFLVDFGEGFPGHDGTFGHKMGTRTHWWCYEGEVELVERIGQPSLSRSLSLTPQARKLLAHLEKTGSVSSREAMIDLDMTSATLARRICDLEAIGFNVIRDRRQHPATGKKYTRYSLAA